MNNLCPPIAERRPATMTHHGEILVDDYAWLRDREDPATIAYLEAENAWAEAHLAPTEPLQAQLYEEMLGRIKETDLSVPYRRGDWWYYSRTEEGKQYPIHCRRRGSMATGAEEVLLDLNLLAEGKSFMALGDFAVSDDGMLLAYSLDDTGFRQYRMAVKHLGTDADLGIARERVTSIAWGADGQTLYYGIEDEDTKRSFQVWRLALQGGDDVLEFTETDEAFNVGVYRTRSRDWMVLHSASHTTSESQVRPATGTDAWRVVLPRVAEREYDLEHHGDHFYIRINDTGRNFRLVRLPVSGGTLEAAEEILAHRTDVMLEGHETFARHLIVHEREDGIPHLAVHQFPDADASLPVGRAPFTVHRIAFPEPAYECGGHANPEFETVRYRLSYQSLVTPSSVYEYDLMSQERVLLKQQEIVGGYEASRFVSMRLHATAADGTRIPISVVRRADVPEDGSAPILLHGYGAYGYPYPVTFSSARLSLLERGMVVAIAHIRGGGELGTPWHDDGKMASKMNTFTDFIACADALVRARVCDADKIAIEGGSAGGLLMGAVTNIARDKWAAVVSQVPFVDVLNTMSDPTLPLTVGEYEEWGNPGVAEQYGWMRAYCPYTNLEPGAYPPTLVRTSLNDSQVMYWEPAKYVAKLRTLATTLAPLYLVTNMGAGHGGASGRYDRLREIALDWAFVLVTLGREG